MTGALRRLMVDRETETESGHRGDGVPLRLCDVSDIRRILPNAGRADRLPLRIRNHVTDSVGNHVRRGDRALFQIQNPCNGKTSITRF